MVLPLIPLALITVGAVTGGGGVALGGKGAWDMKKARDQVDAARKRYEKSRSQTAEAVEVTNGRLEALGGQQQRALIDVVVRMAEFLRRHERQVRENERLLVDGIDVTISRMSGIAGLDVDPISWALGAVGSVTTAIGTGAGVYAAAGSFGAASTGAAISGLSGAAAESATVAFLGGGSVAAGGGGMALGATALNFVTVGPALLVGGLVTQMQGAKAATKARAVQADVAVELAKLDAFAVRLDAVDTRVAEVSSVLNALTRRATAALDLLESEQFDPKAHADRFQQALVLALSVRDVAAAPVVDAEGDVPNESANMTVKYREMIGDAEGE
ncbi:hypothetical protein [Mycolicibacter kumamotonensis]|uniref:Uncharacterized protein n=1 Tax=Mycolicibacter kumamotonensis TaxID=354243 RepID=A0A1B8SGJ4_9MYCO|nr:hypothetical protein [Mycolicibacter kumamotonensis]OBY31838.1 hypothetical protein ACT18_10010 [Mycolicibacter kumamotonensis]